MGCFDGEGETKEIGEKHACAYHYTVSEINGEKSYKIKREVTNATDASEYPRTKVEENCKLICLTSKVMNCFVQGLKFALIRVAMIKTLRTGSVSRLSWPVCGDHRLYSL